jgi:prepilin-type processing-associated H-X9-DG protein
MLEEKRYLDKSAHYSSANYYPHGRSRHAQKANVAYCDGHVGTGVMVPGSLDRRLPSQFVGCLRSEILRLPQAASSQAPAIASPGIVMRPLAMANLVKPAVL